MNYQDYDIKIMFLQSTKTKWLQEVALNLLSVFLLIETHNILQNDNDREFVNKVIIELKCLWFNCMILYGRLRDLQSQRIIERSNLDF